MHAEFRNFVHIFFFSLKEEKSIFSAFFFLTLSFDRDINVHFTSLFSFFMPFFISSVRLCWTSIVYFISNIIIVLYEKKTNKNVWISECCYVACIRRMYMVWSGAKKKRRKIVKLKEYRKWFNTLQKANLFIFSFTAFKRNLIFL